MVLKQEAVDSDAKCVMIFANPIAGRGRGESMARQIETRLTQDGYDVRLFFNKAADVPADQLQIPCRAMVVIGGDGTIRSTLQQVIQADALHPIIPVPLGTANMMAKYLEIHLTATDLASRVSAAVASPRVQLLDAGRANGILFIQVAGVGFDAHLVNHLYKRRNGPITPLSYTIPSLLALRDYKPEAIRVSCDGVQVFPEQPGFAFVGNLSQYGTGFPVLVDAKPNDGLLDLCVVPCRTRSDLIQMFLAASVGQHLGAEGVVYLKGKQIEITAPDAVPLQLDGDPAGTTPVKIDLLPVKIPFIVP